MMDEKKLLDAMSDIDENYIQDAKNFRERKVVRGRFAAKSVAAAAIVVLLAGVWGNRAREAASHERIYEC